MDGSSHERDEGRAVLVSACLLGRSCRYDGSHNRDHDLERELAARGERAVAFCPEEEGGLGTPRPPAWIVGGDAADVAAGTARVVTDQGRDVTAAFLEGARRAVERCQAAGAARAYLKERSPSCGCRETHRDGGRVAGRGVAAELLARAGVEVVGVEGRRG